MNLENERILNSIIQTIDEASFRKTSLEFFKGVPKTTTLILKTSASSDNEKLLAAQAYSKLLEKFGSFAKGIKNKQIIPNEQELNTCEEVVDITYNSNNELMRDASQTATALKVSEIQPILSDMKTLIQRMKSEILPKSSNGGKPSNSLGSVIIILLIGGIVLLVGIFAYKRKRN